MSRARTCTGSIRTTTASPASRDAGPARSSKEARTSIQRASRPAGTVNGSPQGHRGRNRSGCSSGTRPHALPCRPIVLTMTRVSGLASCSARRRRRPPRSDAASSPAVSPWRSTPGSPACSTGRTRRSCPPRPRQRRAAGAGRRGRPRLRIGEHRPRAGPFREIDDRLAVGRHESLRGEPFHQLPVDLAPCAARREPLKPRLGVALAGQGCRSSQISSADSQLSRSHARHYARSAAWNVRAADHTAALAASISR